ncbi:cytochrome c [Aquisalimonas sp.]|uniref:c-type cytochrome n=1 Tax=unclassified Aquisalimonas TaxID=2644645 RepID=UPI0025B7AFE4|nr:cytochrome c [Aquisalimonas sp.]
MHRQLFLMIGTVLALGVVPAQADDVAAGETLYAESCVSCHGSAGRGMASFPALTGRSADYIVERLEQYRAGERVGSNTGLMAPHAAELSDDEIANLSAYISEEFQ